MVNLVVTVMTHPLAD